MDGRKGNVGAERSALFGEKSGVGGRGPIEAGRKTLAEKE